MSTTNTDLQQNALVIVNDFLSKLVSTISRAEEALDEALLAVDLALNGGSIESEPAPGSDPEAPLRVLRIRMDDSGGGTTYGLVDEDGNSVGDYDSVEDVMEAIFSSVGIELDDGEEVLRSVVRSEVDGLAARVYLYNNDLVTAGCTTFETDCPEEAISTLAVDAALTAYAAAVGEHLESEWGLAPDEIAAALACSYDEFNGLVIESVEEAMGLYEEAPYSGDL